MLMIIKRNEIEGTQEVTKGIIKEIAAVTGIEPEIELDDIFAEGPREIVVQGLNVKVEDDCITIEIPEAVYIGMTNAYGRFVSSLIRPIVTAFKKLKSDIEELMQL